MIVHLLLEWIKQSFIDVYYKIRYGFRVSETWDISVSSSDYILPRLKFLRNKVKSGDYGFPAVLIEPETQDKYPAESVEYYEYIDEWIKIIDDIIYALECCNDELFDISYQQDEMSLSATDRDKEMKRYKRMNRGLKYFGKYFRYLEW